MKILVLSDTHGRSRNARKVINREKPFDARFHLGDIEGGEEEIAALAGVPTYMVAGNCDTWSSLPQEAEVVLGGVRFMLTHGHRYWVSASLKELKTKARKNRCDVVLFGHTHRPVEDLSDPSLMVLNPGSLSFPRQADGKPTYMVLTVENGRCLPELRRC